MIRDIIQSIFIRNTRIVKIDMFRQLLIDVKILESRRTESTTTKNDGTKRDTRYR